MAVLNHPSICGPTFTPPFESRSFYGSSRQNKTFLAFESARSYKYDVTSARVKVTIHIGLGEEDARDIALASNTTAPVDSRSKTNARGDYDFIKHYLAQLELTSDSKFRIAYYQNQSGAPRNAHCNVTHLFKLINCLDRNRYNPDGNTRSKHPTGSNTRPRDSEALPPCGGSQKMKGED